VVHMSNGDVWRKVSVIVRRMGEGEVETSSGEALSRRLECDSWKAKRGAEEGSKSATEGVTNKPDIRERVKDHEI
jgi:hypothetical protein